MKPNQHGKNIIANNKCIYQFTVYSQCFVFFWEPDIFINHTGLSEPIYMFHYCQTCQYHIMINCKNKNPAV